VQKDLMSIYKTSCRRAAATVCPHPSPHGRRSALYRRADGNIAAVSHGQHVLTPTAAAAWRANTTVSKVAWWPWPSDLESGVRVMCDVGYLCANFGLPRTLCSRLRPDVCDNQTSDIRQKHRLMPPPIRGRGIINGLQH